MSKEVKLSPQTRAILEAADCSTGYEIPKDDWKNFPWEGYISEIKTIQERVNAELDISLKRDKNVQDASFIDELYILRDDAFLPNGVIVRLVQIGIRFSNFGKLYTIYSSETLDTTKFDVEGMKRMIDDFGWKFVPADELKAIYNGKHDRLKGEVSWWLRFFDYV